MNIPFNMLCKEQEFKHVETGVIWKLEFRHTHDGNCIGQRRMDLGLGFEMLQGDSWDGMQDAWEAIAAMMEISGEWEPVNA